jgi:hypothetical protein
MTTKTAPLFKFIVAASNASGIAEEHILKPSRESRSQRGEKLYFLACRLRWLACIYAHEKGMKRSEITEAGKFHAATVYQAGDKLREMKENKPLCRMLRDIMGELAAMDGRKA